MPLLQLMEGRKIVVAEETNEEEEIDGGKKETLSGKNVLFKFEEFPKQLKVERK
tara:strand:+ start:66 stop:227 length:162 start_codon:yes stop_codon:yes gene_type:complete